MSTEILPIFRHAELEGGKWKSSYWSNWGNTRDIPSYKLQGNGSVLHQSVHDRLLKEDDPNYSHLRRTPPRHGQVVWRKALGKGIEEDIQLIANSKYGGLTAVVGAFAAAAAAVIATVWHSRGGGYSRLD